MPRAARSLRISVLLDRSHPATPAVFDGILDVARGRPWHLTDDADPDADGLICDHGVWDGPAPAVTLAATLGTHADVRPDPARVHALAVEHFRGRGFLDVVVDPPGPAALTSPVGCFVTSDAAAVALVDALLAAGRAVPDDAAVLGLGDDRLTCERAAVPLSSVDVAPRVIGRRAALRLDRLLRHRPVPRDDLVPPAGVVRRASTDTLAVADADLAAAVRFVRDHAFGPVRTGDVVRATGLDRRTLHRRFIKHLGRPPMDFVRQCRLEKAAELLAGGHGPVSAVATACGFRLPQHLSVAFKRAYGQSPGDFRSVFCDTSTAKTKTVRPA